MTVEWFRPDTVHEFRTSTQGGLSFRISNKGKKIKALQCVTLNPTVWANQKHIRILMFVTRKMS